LKVEVVGLDRRRRHSLERNMFVQTLPFTVSLVRTDAKLNGAVALRKVSFNRHYSNIVGHDSNSFGEAERKDVQAGTVLLIATSKIDGSVVGSLRIETNLLRPFSLEHEVSLPDGLKGRPLALVTRFSVVNGREGIGVFLGLGKAMYLYCLAKQIQVVLMFTAFDSLQRLYLKFGFRPIDQKTGKFQLNEYPNLALSGFYCDLSHLRTRMQAQSRYRDIWVCDQHS
jgi:hypothetical protein